MSTIMLNKSLVSAQWLAENIHADNLIILDASMKPIGATTVVTPENIYIPGALRFDFDDVICDKNSTLPHTMPSADVFTDEMQKLGIHADSVVIAYDKIGVYSSPRAWWMLRAMGHTQVAVLDGGIRAWVNAGFDVADKLRATPTQRGNFISRPQVGMFVDSAQVVNVLNDSNFVVIDARSAGRFNGTEPEPRKGLRGGHMPNAENIPFVEVQDNGAMLPAAQLQSIFSKYQNKKMIFSCGSGVTSCVLALAAEQAGYKDLSVYDGSWSEWGLESTGLPVKKMIVI